MGRAKTEECGGAPAPSNDNLEVANDNRRAEYMRGYMRRRRRGAKTLRALLRDGLAVVAEARVNTPEAKEFVAAVKTILGPDKPPRKARKGA